MILLIHPPMCRVCGIPMGSNGVCSQCRINKPQFQLLRSWAIYEGPIRQAVLRIKYRRDITLGFELSNRMSKFVKNLNLPVEIVIPVPLGSKRKTERGYNQASLIAYPLSLQFGWDYVPEGLVRIRETGSQVGLNPGQRNENVKDAFDAVPRKVTGRNVLIIDDVATTGATLSSCTSALKAAGANEVYAVTFARTIAAHGYSVI
jgi:ComF family protein